jgi:hypothetical protein
MSGNNKAADHEGQNGEAEVVLVETAAGEVTVDSSTGEVLEPVTADLELAHDERCEAVTHAGGNLYQCALSAEHEGEHSFSVVDETDAPEPEPEPEPADDAQVQALFRAVKNYSKAVVGVLGADLGDFTLCPCCDPRTPGLYIEHPHSDEQVYMMRAILGLPDISTYAKDVYSKQCEVCHGRRRVLSGAMDGPEVTLECLACKGRGWMPVGPERDAQRPPIAATFDAAPAAIDAEPAPVLPLAAQQALRQMLDSAELARVNSDG